MPNFHPVIFPTRDSIDTKEIVFPQKVSGASTFNMAIFFGQVFTEIVSGNAYPKPLGKFWENA